MDKGALGLTCVCYVLGVAIGIPWLERTVHRVHYGRNSSLTAGQTRQVERDREGCKGRIRQGGTLAADRGKCLSQRSGVVRECLDGARRRKAFVRDGESRRLWW